MPEQEGWSAATRGSLHRIMIALVHLWITEYYLRKNRLPEAPSVWWVYDMHLDWGRDLLKRKRVQITIEVVDEPR